MPVPPTMITVQYPSTVLTQELIFRRCRQAPRAKSAGSIKVGDATYLIKEHAFSPWPLQVTGFRVLAKKYFDRT